jgi:hypothetical protein
MAKVELSARLQRGDGVVDGLILTYRAAL